MTKGNRKKSVVEIKTTKKLYFNRCCRTAELSLCLTSKGWELLAPIDRGYRSEMRAFEFCPWCGSKLPEVRHCEACNEPFLTLRPDRAFCSTTCRLRIQKRRYRSKQSRARGDEWEKALEAGDVPVFTSKAK